MAKVEYWTMATKRSTAWGEGGGVERSTRVTVMVSFMRTTLPFTS